MRSLTASRSLAIELQAERLGEFIVEGHRAGRFDRLGGHLEFGVLTGEVFGLVVLGELDLEGAGLAGADADELLLEARNEGVGADQHRHVVAGAAVEGLAADLAGKLDGDAVAVFRLGALGLGRIGLVLVGDALQRLLDLGLGDLGGRAGELDVLEIGERDRRHDFDRQRVIEVRLAGDHLLDRVLLLRQCHLRVGGELVAALADDLVVGVAHRLLDHLGHRRAAIHALEVRDRHLAGAETVDADFVLEVVKARIDLRLQFGRRHDHAEFALETFGKRFGNLH